MIDCDRSICTPATCFSFQTDLLNIRSDAYTINLAVLNSAVLRTEHHSFFILPTCLSIIINMKLILRLIIIIKKHRSLFSFKWFTFHFATFIYTYWSLNFFVTMLMSVIMMLLKLMIMVILVMVVMMTVIL